MPANPARRYCLCRNEATEIRERQTRERLLELTLEGLQYIATYKRRTTVEKLGARVGKVLAKYKIGKFIQWSIEAADAALSNQHHLVWSVDNGKIAQEKRLDGCYIISTDVDIKTMDTQQVVRTYNSFGDVKQAFRTMKTTHLKVRPVFHKTDARICSHLFLCMLSYYLQWHMRMRLKPLFEADGEHKNRRWTVKGVIECLASITRNKVSVGDAIFYRNSKPTSEQQEILNLLEVSM